MRQSSYSAPLSSAVMIVFIQGLFFSISLSLSSLFSLCIVVKSVSVFLLSCLTLFGTHVGFDACIHVLDCSSWSPSLSIWIIPDFF